MYNQKQWVERDDSLPGYIYLMKAEGFHGVIPGCLLSRVKIGLSRNPQKRLDDFHGSQFPCTMKIVRTIYVENMTAVEAELHRQFKDCNVKLHRSREYFDFTPLQFLQCNTSFSRYESRKAINVPFRLILGSLIGLVGVAMFFNQSIQSVSNQASPKVSTTPTPVVKHLIKMRR